MSMSTIVICHPGRARTLQDVLNERGTGYVAQWMLREAFRRNALEMNEPGTAQAHAEAIAIEPDRQVCADALDRIELHVKP